ncbi:MAG: hypothetical protein V4578_13885 [Pseudomonadota bacterium]
MIPIHFATLAGAALLLSASSLAMAAADHDVVETLRVESEGGRVLVHVTIENRGKLPVFIPHEIAVDKEVFGKVFEIHDVASGALLPYQGIMVKRGPYTRDDYVTLKPRGVRRNTLDITASYGFLAGPHTYRLSYQGSYVTDIHQLDASTAITAAPAEFSHVGGATPQK